MKTVLISGAAGGLGKELVSHALSQGHKVIALVREMPTAPWVHGGNVAPGLLQVLPVDMTESGKLATLRPRLSSVDVLINNAGIAEPSAVEDANNPEHVFAVNYFAALALIQSVLPGMRDRRDGLIINVSSLSAHIGLPGDGIYSASKAALERTSESLRSEVAPFGIRVVNAVPGGIATAMQRKMQIAANLTGSSPYRLLVEKLVGELSGGGDIPAQIAEEIFDLLALPKPPLTVPVGEQAKTVLKELGVRSEQERQSLVEEYSDAAWWFKRMSGTAGSGLN